MSQTIDKSILLEVLVKHGAKSLFAIADMSTKSATIDHQAPLSGLEISPPNICSDCLEPHGSDTPCPPLKPID